MDVALRHPLSLSGDLPPNLLLAAKLLVLLQATQTAPWRMPEPFLAFIPALEALPRALLPGLYWAGAAALFLTRASRAACLLLGGSLLAAMLACIPYYSNGKLFGALLLLLLGLYEPSRGAWALRGQLALMYACCALNKALDPDWLSGRFFDNWFAARLSHGPYLAASALLPPLWLARLLTWPVIAAEAALGALFLIPRLHAAALWTAALLHTGMLVLLWGESFGEFYFAVLASFLVFAEWPASGRLTLPEGAAGNAAAGALRVLDPDGFWTTARGPRLAVESGGRRHEGAAALREALLRTPAALIALLLVCLAVRPARPVLALAGMALFLPWRARLEAPVVLYDGVCGLCDRFVQFVLRSDGAMRFRFAPLQGPFAAELLARHGIDHADLDTVYVVSDPGGPHERLLKKSQAVFSVLSRLDGAWPAVALLRALPAPLLDPFYDAVASVRYRLFGRFDACPLPRPEWRARFLA